MSENFANKTIRLNSIIPHISSNRSTITVPKIWDDENLQYLDRKTQRNISPALRGKILFPKYPINWDSNSFHVDIFSLLNKNPLTLIKYPLLF